MSDVTTCDDFDRDVAELALELLDGSDRDRLMLHAAGCERCRVELELLAGIADRLVLLAPAGEPPVGFEQRALAAMSGRSRRARAASLRLRSRRAWIVAAAAGIVSLAGLVGSVAGRSLQAAPDARVAALERIGIHEARSGRLLGAGGVDHGSVIVTGPEVALLTMNLAALAAGTYHCVIIGSDGVPVEIAAWPIGDSGRGSWTVPLRVPTTEIRQVLVTGDDGSEVARATLR